jgi:hypothetical protein
VNADSASGDGSNTVRSSAQKRGEGAEFRCSRQGQGSDVAKLATQASQRKWRGDIVAGFHYASAGLCWTAQ